MIFQRLILLTLQLSVTSLIAQPQWKTFSGAGTGTQFISTYHADQSGNLWLGTNNGVIVYSDSQWIPISRIEDTESGINEPLGNVTRFFEDRSGTIFVACERKLFLYESGVWISYQDNLFPAYTARLFLQDSRGDIWFCSEQEEFNQYESVLSKPIMNGTVSRYSNGRWINYGYSAGGSHYVQAGDPKEFYTGLVEDVRGYIWVGTVDGLFVYTGTGWLTLKDETLPGVYITGLSQDLHGDIWVGTTNGIARFNGEAWQIYKRRDGVGGNNISWIMSDSRGWIWAGIQGNMGSQGLSCYDGNEWKHFSAGKEIPTGNLINDFEEFDLTGLVMGRNGVACFNGVNWIMGDEFTGLEGSRFFAMVADSTGRAYIASDKGLFAGSGTTYDRLFAPASGSWEVTALLNDSRGRIWVSTSSREVCLSDGGKASFFGPLDGLPDDVVRDIIEDKAGRIWLIYRKEAVLWSSEF